MRMLLTERPVLTKVVLPTVSIRTDGVHGSRLSTGIVRWGRVTDDRVRTVPLIALRRMDLLRLAWVVGNVLATRNTR